MAAELDRQCEHVTGPEPGGRADARANRERVLQAAHEVFATHGMDAEIQEIGRRAGVGVGTIYRHFGNKDGLVRALLEQFEESLDEVCARASAEADPREALRTLLAGVFDLVDTHRAIAQTMRDAGIRPGRPIRAEQQTRCIMEQAAEAGVTREGFPVEFLLAYLHGLVIAYLEIRKTETVEEARRLCIAAFFGGVTG